jgi:hypothetical protein
VIVLAVEIKEFLVLKVGNGFWISAGVEFILALFEQILVDVLQKRVFRVAHSTFHFIVDDAFHLQFGVGIIPFFKLKSVSFLSEVIVV